MRSRAGPITPGYVRRISPTAVSVMPFTGSSVDDMEQLRWLAQQYAKQVPFGLDRPMITRPVAGWMDTSSGTPIRPPTQATPPGIEGEKSLTDDG